MSGITGKTDGKKFNFGFDKVFQPQSSQSAVFDEISQLVQSALDGYNTCIFAYGQTGSGKTYTMEGPGISSEIDFPIVDSKCKGMIPRAVEQIWISAEALKDKGWTYEMEAMYIEIYNESIKDLLAKKQVSEDTKYDIKHDAKGNTTITNATTIKVRSPTQVYELLSRASHNRSVGRTDMNERSSRSHSVFQLKLVGTNSITTESISGLLNLIDLAGSERLNQSGATGQRLKETQHINKSLTHLGDVIAALANKESHIPYRNSKLTYLLQNSLGGNSKTLMFVNISPRVSDLNETISSLRFATKVNACEIGTAKKQNKTDLK
jgi:kinesin family protein C1